MANKNIMKGLTNINNKDKNAQAFFYDEHKKLITSGLLSKFLDCTIEWPYGTAYMSISEKGDDIACSINQDA